MVAGLSFSLSSRFLPLTTDCSKIVEMEEELRVVGNNLKSLELSEEKALEREDTYNAQIRELTTRLKEVSHSSYLSSVRLCLCRRFSLSCLGILYLIRLTMPF